MGSPRRRPATIQKQLRRGLVAELSFLRNYVCRACAQCKRLPHMVGVSGWDKEGCLCQSWSNLVFRYQSWWAGCRHWHHRLHQHGEGCGYQHLLAGLRCSPRC